MIAEQFIKDNHWGLLTSVTIKDCSHEHITNCEYLYNFICDLVNYIDMRRYGEPIIERFGEGHLYGYSIIQLIHTSSITMHFDELDNRAFIDIFSCKGYEPDDAAAYCAKYLGGHVSSFGWQFRD